MDKEAIRRAVLARLEAELASQTEAAHSSRSEATDADSRAEGKFDMRGQSAAYLAEGQARLASEIAAAAAAYRALPLRAFGPGEAAAVGALATLEHRGVRTLYFLGPARGGIEVEIGGKPVTVITAASALGRSLIGRKAGDTVALHGRGGTALHTLARVE